MSADLFPDVQPDARGRVYLTASDWRIVRRLAERGVAAAATDGARRRATATSARTAVPSPVFAEADHRAYMASRNPREARALGYDAPGLELAAPGGGR